MNLNEFLNSNPNNLEDITNYYLEYLKSLSSKNFPFDEYINLTGSSVKFISSIEKYHYLKLEEKDKYSSTVEKLGEDIRRYHRYSNINNITKLLLNTKARNLYYVQNSFENLYSQTLYLINEAVKWKNIKNEHLDINSFYKPENSNKEQVKKLIKESIDLINQENSLTEKSRIQLINYLEDVVKNLDKENINWTQIIGKIKETIIVLGALGSFIGGLSPLFQAKEKLEESTAVIEKTSINVNNTTVNETFNIHSIEQFNKLGLIYENSSDSIKIENK